MAGNIESTYAPPKGGGITGELTSGNKRFTFGHGGRHLEGSNLSIDQVQNAIMENASRNLPNVGEDSVSRYIEIGGELIEYRIMKRGDNLYNIGTYFIKRK
ncbi:hypothetical protein EII38_09680 [Streptococcus minor]|uniref:Uncharacterized protein n=1 Tax=Streptococcus minor TaxID=229549 RepID=A0A3P1V5R0_9STRE|nr:hypothetical protein [Streptococcus minor]RRD29469.1 hypothetical protein EII38_09680 [Streptococcus minor]